MDYTMSREIGNHGKAAEAHDVVDLPGVDKVDLLDLCLIVRAIFKLTTRRRRHQIPKLLRNPSPS